jgi:2-polyprenyl-3-methyl-5-hydroxy-6-metoxy-1,4-benzoquinol methylase
MKNEDLTKFYDSVYIKGEQKHYSRLIINASNEFSEIIDSIEWKSKSVLDVGCGTGKFDKMIADLGADVLALDYSSKAIELAKETYKKDKIKFEVGEASKITGSYDVIVSLGTLEHMDNPFEILKIYKKHLKKDGQIIITCPNWINPRGYILMCLKHLFDAPITLADLHYLTAQDFKEWAEKLNMNLNWKTFDHSWAHGEILITDLKKRLPNVLRDSKLNVKEENIFQLLNWLETKSLPIDQTQTYSGAMALYILS